MTRKCLRCWLPMRTLPQVFKLENLHFKADKCPNCGRIEFYIPTNKDYETRAAIEKPLDHTQLTENIEHLEARTR